MQSSESFLSALQIMGVDIFYAENFHQGEVLWFFACCETVFYASLARIVFRYLYKNFQKMPITYEEFLNKFVNLIYTFIILHGVLNLQDAKNHSQHEEIFEARRKKITFCRAKINRALTFSRFYYPPDIFWNMPQQQW